MLEIGGEPLLGDGDTEFCGLVYPDGDKITKNLAARLRSEPFYQHDKLALSLKYVKRKRVAVDCGAWVGAWSRELARQFDKVLSIEANADNVRCLQKNLAHCDNVILMHCALGEVSTPVLACAQDDGANVGSRIVAGEGGRFSVNMRRLDDLPFIQQLTALDYLKVHVNGCELKALKGAVATITRHRPVMTVVVKAAIEDYGDSADAIHAFLERELGYRIVGQARVYEIWAPR